jgi:hypothetical protein
MIVTPPGSLPVGGRVERLEQAHSVFTLHQRRMVVVSFLRSVDDLAFCKWFRTAFLRLQTYRWFLGQCQRVLSAVDNDEQKPILTIRGQQAIAVSESLFDDFYQ